MSHIEIPDLSFSLVFYLIQVPFCALIVLVVLWPLDNLGDLLVACSFVGVVLTIGGVLLRMDAGEFEGFGVGQGPGYDITNDPLNPTQKARKNWEKAVDRVTEDDEQD